MTDLPTLLTVADVAVIVGLSEYTVRQAIREGDLPASKLRGRIRIAETDVRLWIESSPAPTSRPITSRRFTPGPTRMPPRELATPENAFELLARARARGKAA